MQFPREVYGALSVQRVPAGGIGAAKKLCFQPDTHQSILQIHTDHALRRLPGGSAGSSPQNPDALYRAPDDLDTELRGAKSLAVMPQAGLPGKGTSGRGRQNALGAELFARGNHGNSRMEAKGREIFGQIGMRKKIQNQGSVQALGKVIAGIIDNRGQAFVNGDDLQGEKPLSVFLDSRDLGVSAAVLLEHQEMLACRPGSFRIPPGG